MIKIKTYFVILLVCLLSITVTADAQTLTSAEIDFANFIVKADINLEKSDVQTAENELSQANAILLSNPNIDQSLQGHFYKVKGKFYMKDSLNTALSYFNTSLSRFSGAPSEQAKVKIFIGIAYFYANNFNTSRNYFNEAKTFFLINEDQASLAQVINNLGILAYQDGNSGNAVSLCDQAFSINTNIGESSEASKNQQNITYFLNGQYSGSNNGNDEDKGPEPVNHGGGGTSGSGTTIDTSGGGTIVVNGGH